MSDELHVLATEIYSAGMVLDAGRRSPDAVGIAEIVAFLTSPTATLTPGQTRRLFSDRTARATWTALKARLAARNVPTLAAASTFVPGEATERRFENGILNLTPSRNGRHWNLLFRFDEGARPTGPTILVLEHPDGRVGKTTLPAPDWSGEVFLILDGTADAETIALVGDPTVQGMFVEIGDGS